MDAVHPSAPEGLARLRALVELTRRARTLGQDALLREVAAAVTAICGYRTVVVNLYRPAWDDLEVVEVAGDEDCRAALLHKTMAWSEWERLLDPRFEVRGAYVITTRVEASASYHRDIAPSADPGAWGPHDDLLLPLRDADGALLGVVSVDDPVDGRRPTEESIDLAMAVCGHAAVALEAAYAKARADRVRAALGRLLAVSSALTGSRRPEEVLGGVCHAVADGLGFGVVSVLTFDREDRLVAAAVQGVPATLDVSRQTRAILAPLHDARFEREGCILADGEAFSRIVASRDVPYRSRRNGRGPRAWRNHALLAPLHDADGRLVGYLWADEPEDRLVPSTDELRTLRLFADQAANALIAAERMERLHELADRDPLTGVRNRRGLGAALAALDAHPAGGSLLMCDLDHFKQVNDRHGHAAGDRVLERFGALLVAWAPGRELVFRLGGEEFCILLPSADAPRALALAETLRGAARGELRAGQDVVTLSVGAATSSPELPSSSELVRAADRALYAAKRRGRDRVVAYDPSLPELGAAAPQDDRPWRPAAASTSWRSR
jgi:diguanylate cyclase (GGDEF)-like protein